MNGNNDFSFSEKHGIKISVATAIAVIVFLVTTTVTFAGWKSDIENTLSTCDEEIEDTTVVQKNLNHEIDILRDKAAERDIQIAEINTKLANIETMLIEIRTDLRRN